MNATQEQQPIVAIYNSHTEADVAIRALQKSGFDMKKLSIVGKEFRQEEHPVGFYNSGDRMMFWGGLGAFWGGLWGMLFGSALFFIPVIGPLVVMGPLVGWIVGTAEGAVVGGSAGILAAALASAGIPENSVVKYEQELRAGKFVVVAHGTPSEVEVARAILGTNATHVSEQVTR
ncbi:MAG: permease [Polyangiaceae bacterium]